MDYQQIPKDETLLHAAFSTYKSPDQAIALKSEQNRSVFAENFEIRRALPLSTLCLIILAQNYKNRPIILPKISAIQLKIFYDSFDENIPIDKCLHIKDEYFWKSIYIAKCTDKMLVKHKNQQKDVCWKNLSVTLKYVELIETTPYECWISEEMEEITKIVSPYVTELNINKLQAMRDASFEKQMEVSSVFSNSTRDEGVKDSELKASNVKYNFPFEECHHVDLSVLGNLLNLNSLNVEFVPPKLARHYHERFFKFSYFDIQNLARGISEMKNLRTFKIRRSRMDSVKFSTILEGLKSISVEKLEFFFCQLDDNCGEALYEYLVSTKTLNYLDLSGNYFKNKTIDCLSKGLETSYSKLAQLVLSNNPISDNSLCNLTKTLEAYEHLRVLKLSGIKCYDQGATGIAKLVERNAHMIELHVIAVRINGADLIEALIKNHQIQKIIFQGCGFTLEEEFKVEVLLNRNRFIKANPYIGNFTKAEEKEFNAFINRTKNQIFIKALEDKKTRKECLKHRASKNVEMEHETGNI